MVHVGVLSDHFGDPGAHRDAQQAPGGSVVHFYRFWGQFEEPSGGTLENIVCFSVIWGAKVADSFHVHVFDDVGVDILPECSGCMCLKHNKNSGFREIPVFPSIHEFSVQRGGFRCHFGVCRWPWGHFFSFVRVFGRGLKFDDFPGIPLGAPRLRAHRSGW